MTTAFFIRYPRRMNDLYLSQPVRIVRAYEVVKEITLPAIDYENFVTDLRADRQFLEDHAALCGEGDPMRCLLVRCRGRRDGLLVVPRGAYVQWAAYLPESIALPRITPPSKRI